MKKILKFIRNIFILMFVIILIGLGCVFYAFKIEPYMLSVEKVELNQEYMQNSLRVVQISDLHIKENFTYKNVKKVVDKVNKQNPDIVVFTGDLYDNYSIYNDDENIMNLLSQINSKYGKLAVYGNRDYGGGAVRAYEDIMNGAGFTVLKNDSIDVGLENGGSVTFIGLDDCMLGEPYMPYVEGKDYVFLLAHEPDMVNDYQEYDYNLALSGHSHGGQIDIPFFDKINDKAIEVTEFCKMYKAGLYDIAENKQIYVNTGIGTTHISARFGVVPKITVFDIGIETSN